MQLPHFQSYMASDAASRKYNAPTLASFAALPMDKRDDFYEKEQLSPQQVHDVEAVLNHLPINIDFDFW